MDLHRHLRSLALLIFILATYFSTVLARHHPVRHRHNRHKRQHAHNSQYLPGSFVIDGNPNAPEAGNWGPWSEPSECSRSCGGGVAFQTRRCRDLSDTGEELCQGGTKRYFSCNIQDCPEASADFRAEQCAEFNAVPLEGRYYKWVPYTKAPNKCELNCMPKGDRFYYRHKRKVIDGTRCDEEKLDICVDGQCMPVGCDMMLGSTAREDNCRECGGDGSSCNTIVDTLEMDDLQVGYNDILLIPAGATNIQVREIKASNNYLAIRNVTGHYYLNGNWRIDFPRSLKFAGTIFHYERKPHGFFAPESLSALGPTSEPIYIVLLYQETNPGVHYEYSIPKGVAQQTDPDSYSWITDEFSECSATCGGGYQTRRVQCARRKDLQVVADYLCDLSLQPQSNQTCSADPCPPQWFVSAWGPCSETCGEGGIQVRQVYCEQIVSGGRPSVVDDSLCIDILAHNPPTTQKCSEDVPCPQWHVGPWKPCNRLCGEGHQKRNVRCFRRVEGKIEVLGDSACPIEKPEDEKPCEIRPCEGVDWVVSDWSGCEDKCGLTQETRRVHCANQAGKLYPDEYCHAYRLPELTRSCESPIPCEHEWFASQWSECSAHCGVGVKTRKVFCGEEVGDTVKKVPDEKCDLRKKYEAESNCTGVEECTGQWYTGPWSACSVPCGGGRMTRKVLCYVENATVDIKNCDPSLIHFASETCNNNPCTDDEIMPMEPTKAVTEEDEEEECEDDIEGSLITMETTLGLGVTPIAGGTGKQEIDFEGSGGVDFDKLEFEEGTSESPSSDVSIEATDGMLLSTASDTLLGTASPSEISSSSVSEGVTDLTDLMLSDSAGTSFDSTDTTGSGDEETSEDAKSTDVTSSDDTKATDFTSSEDTASTDVSSKLSSLSTDGESSSSTGSETSGSTVEGTSSSVDFTSSSLESSSISPTMDSSGATESSVSSESSSSGSSVQSSSSDSSPSSASTEPSVSMSSELTSEEGSGMTGTTDLETDITTLTGSGIPFFGEVEEGSGETITSIEESSTVQTHISSTSATESSLISGTEISSTSATEISSSSETSSTVEAESSQTEVSETVESSSVYTSESSPDVSGTSESGASTDGSSTITVLTTESSVLTSESPLSTAESPVTEPTSETESTVSPLSTESDEYTTGSTEEYTSTEVSGESSAEVEEEIKKTTLTPAEIAITKEQKVKKCKRKKKKPKKEPVKCETTEFGCCPDGKSVAQGPFSKGCAQPETCQETEFGCCPDGVSPAEGKKFKGCPPSFCAETLFGCCPDGVRIAEGNDLEGCEEIILECKDTDFGCCPDGHTAATGPNNAGCFECEGSGECDTCQATKFGCCSDGVRAADGPDGEGCEDILATEEPEEPVDCSNSTHGCCPDGIKVATGPYFEGCGVIDKENCSASYFGCCPDGQSPATGPRYAGCRMPCEDEPFGCCNDTITPAHGPNQAGCCLTTPYGCCPDNIRPAQGPQLEGCGCQYSTYGCCPDNSTVARGPNAEGCGCQYTKYGCCPNRYTPAAGPEYQGCPCYTYQFGCCPDGVNIAKGPYNQGCGCENTEFGCCPDDKTPSPDVNKEGCGCEASKFGCCPDGSTEAQGDKFEGCKEIPVLPGEACTQEKDRGTCRDFKVKWFFDMEYGGCSRFWYGGCEGNDNRFASQEECKERCVEPPGRDACFLPKIEGPCEGYYPHWYYDAERKQCGQFIYGGCLGNNNRFETREECDELCVVPDTLDVCEQPKMKGPCRGNFSRWYYDQDLRMCQEFPYGGCHGNRNNFFTEIECQHQCLQPGRSRDYCALPRDEGNCTERHPRWFFDASENRCMPFYYSGCGGNDNRFQTQDICEADCPARIEQDLCLLPAAAGECHNYTERWYYDSYHVRCTPFFYGGCGGNQNNFLSMEACQRRCESGYNTPEPPQQFKQEWCFLPDDHGPCSDSMAKWFYDSRDGVCKQFLYGGCQGNQNKFTTREECEQHCGHVQDACDLPRVVGPCSGSINQWYYDRSTDSCYEFDYGGCQGNANRFNDRQQCEEHCRVLISTAPAFVPSALTITTQSPFIAPEPSRDICAMPVDTGPCDSEIAAWYYNKTSSECHAFIYGGCGGNANRFESEEQCERQCGDFKGQDVCNLPADIGPCRGNFRKWFYNPTSGECEEFGFGGCQGNGNRFSSLRECEHICLHRDEPQPRGNDTTLSNQAICRLPVDTGPCSGHSYKRWYYDDDRQTCIPFIYSGCAGNRNRFKNFQSCLKFCAPDGNNVIDVESPPEKPEEDPCLNARLECNTLRCPYGVEKYLDNTYCERCQCHDPCKDQICPGGTECAVDLFRNPRTGSTEFRAACRSTNKPGKCPRFEVDDENCVHECQTDADCTGDNKCCFSGCVSSCLSPLFDALTTEAPRTHHEPQAVPPRFEDRDVDPRIQAQEGTYCTLPCTAIGNPTPTITWRRGAVMIDNSGRYKLLLNGSLQIIGLYRKDTGVYVCLADNGVGQPIQREYHLEVTEPTAHPAEVIGEDRTYVVVTLGAPTILQCYAVGWPPPTVTWWRGDRMLPFSSEQYEQRRDYSLLIRSVTLRNLGHYTCQAYNGYGRAASWTVTVQAVGPVYTSSPGDSVYNEFLIPSPKRPDAAPEPIPTRPSYPFRPVRPPGQYRPRPSPTPPPYRPPPPPPPEPTEAPEVPPEPYAPEREDEEPSRVFTVPVQTTISLTRTVYPIGSDISIPCDVDGYPIPHVVWYKDDELLEPNERIQITENHRLRIVRANGSDAGSYKCSASNQYGSHSSTVSIAVEGIYIHPNCTDNPFFANCKLIVEGRYCTHKYYARFCCKSCTQAGQLPSDGPHLDKSGTLSNSRRK